MGVFVPYFLAFMAAQTSYDYGNAPEPRLRYEMNVQYRVYADCLIAAERKDQYYRQGYSYLIDSRCSIYNPNNHR
jgi:hypothetical protein